MKTATHVSTRQVLNDFALACMLARGSGATGGRAAAGFVSLVAYVNALKRGQDHFSRKGS